MVELVDTLASKASSHSGVWVRVPLSAPFGSVFQWEKASLARTRLCVRIASDPPYQISSDGRERGLEPRGQRFKSAIW